MPATKQAAAIAFGNAMLSLANQMTGLRAAVNDLVTQYNSESHSAVWTALATAPLNTDGSLGAADGSPNTAHPIDTRVAANSGLNRAVSETQLVAMVTFMMDFQKFLTNQAVGTAQRNQTIDDLAS
jgi:hypothetical protein